MANSILDLGKLPEIDILKDLGVTLDVIQEEMVLDYQNEYARLTGKECVLYAANPYRLIMTVLAGQIYQQYEVMNYMFQQNFIHYMEDPVLWNWGANLGFAESNEKASVCTLEFSLNERLDFDVAIPKGTRATAGDDVFFASDEDCVIPAGEFSALVSATCTEKGAQGNSYAIGQINVIADPVPNLSTVQNVDASSGGSDEWSGDLLREQIFLFPHTYSTAGPVDAYEYFVKKFDAGIIDVRIVTNPETATVEVYVMLEGGQIPETTYLDRIKTYLTESGNFPDTDKISVLAPDVVYYDLKATYYISRSDRENETLIKESVQEAADAYVEKQQQSLGYDINPDIFFEYARVAGAKRIELIDPAFTRLKEHQIAICRSVDLKYGGLEDD